MSVKTLIPRGSPQNAVGLTTVLAFAEYRSNYSRLWVVLYNEDVGIEELTLIGDVSRDGVAKIGSLRQQDTAPAGECGRIELNLNGPEAYARVAVQSDGSTVPFSFELFAELR